MNRILLRSAAVLVSLTFLHSGSTDDITGHYDQYTGEYHYHHGYPAHDHSETNADGTINCPYIPESQRKLKPSVFEDMPYLKEHIKNQIAYEESLKKESADTSSTGDTDMSLTDTFIAGTAVAVITSLVSWAINKHKHRK